jgi:hypothetical protein
MEYRRPYRHCRTIPEHCAKVVFLGASDGPAPLAGGWAVISPVRGMCARKAGPISHPFRPPIAAEVQTASTCGLGASLKEPNATS